MDIYRLTQLKAQESSEYQMRMLRSATFDLVQVATKLGFVLTVEQVAHEPLAMGNYVTTVNVRAAIKREG